MTLLEVLLACAVLSVIAIAGMALAQGSRAGSRRSAVAQFDAELAYAESLAANSGNGATLVFTPGTTGDGFVLTVYSGRPTSAGAMQQASLALIHGGAITEAKLSGIPFSVFLDGAGHASARSGSVSPGTIVASDPGCPLGEPAIALRFSDSRGSDTRTIPCNAAIAGAPAAIGTVSPR